MANLNLSGIGNSINSQSIVDGQSQGEAKRITDQSQKSASNESDKVTISGNKPDENERASTDLNKSAGPAVPRVKLVIDSLFGHVTTVITSNGVEVINKDTGVGYAGVSLGNSAAGPNPGSVSPDETTGIDAQGNETADKQASSDDQAAKLNNRYEARDAAVAKIQSAQSSFRNRYK